MKKNILLFLFLTSGILFCQQQKMSYHFDYFSISNYKSHEMGIDGKMFYMCNTKDSTYSLTIVIDKGTKQATLRDYKKDVLIKFDTTEDFEKIEDLKKLTNSKLYTKIETQTGNHYKNHVEDFEFEKDTVTNKTIIHLTQYKNNKRKKIINEHYYFFGNSSNFIYNYKNSLKSYLIKKYNLNFIENENLEKSICLIEGKISTEFSNIKVNNVDYTFEFNIDEVFPKNYYGTTILMN